ncbi:hypothetical protein HDE_06485 [Halotydeus destructor]|nr:hypothetical protein HDE_06485 [Halotydeus destructor]
MLLRIFFVLVTCVCGYYLLNFYEFGTIIRHTETESTWRTELLRKIAYLINTDEKYYDCLLNGGSEVDQNKVQDYLWFMQDYLWFVVVIPVLILGYFVFRCIRYEFIVEEHIRSRLKFISQKLPELTPLDSEVTMITRSFVQQVEHSLNSDPVKASYEMDFLLLRRLQQERYLSCNLLVAKSSLETKLAKCTETEQTVFKLRTEIANHFQEKVRAEKMVIDEKKWSKKLEKDRTEIQNQLSRSRNKVTELEKKISSSTVPEKQIAQYKDAIRGLQTCISKLKSQIGADQDTMDSLIAAQHVAIRDSKKLESDFNELQNKYREKIEDLVEVQLKLDESCKVNGYNVLKLNALKSELRAKDSAIGELKKPLQLMSDSCRRQPERFCPICLVPHFELESNGTDMMALTSCGHVLCSSCLESQSLIKPICPLCQATFEANQYIKLFF